MAQLLLPSLAKFQSPSLGREKKKNNVVMKYYKMKFEMNKDCYDEARVVFPTKLEQSWIAMIYISIGRKLITKNCYENHLLW